MTKIFQIVDGICHWEVPFGESLESIRSNYPPDCQFEEAPEYVRERWTFDDTQEGDARFVRPIPPEGFLYDDETGTFYPQEAVPVMLAEEQANKQAENKMLLATYLAKNPITWVDGKKYGITQEDQDEINLNLSQYQIRKMAGEENPILEWHAIHEACTPWTVESLTALVIAISDAVYPWFNKMQSYKAQIYACTDRQQVKDIVLDYEAKKNESENEED